MIKALSEEGYKSRPLSIKLKKLGYDISHMSVSNVIRGIGKRREAAAKGEIFKYNYQRPARSKIMLAKLKDLTNCENPKSQRIMAIKCNTSQTTINRAIHNDLNLKTRRKSKVHKLLPKHKKNRRVNSLKLLKTHLQKKNMEFVVTLDESWIELSDCNRKRRICYISKESNIPENWVFERKESFSPKFMVIGIITGRGVLPLIEVLDKTKVNSQYYIDHVLTPLVYKYLPQLYPNELHKVFVHHDSATSHTSTLTTNWMKKTEEELGIKFIDKSSILVKSPDASPLDFYGFGYLKQRLAKRKARTLGGLRKVAKEEWSTITKEMILKVYNDWYFRLKCIRKRNGEHIEHVRQIHKRLIK
jgi:hypothetical protein